MSLTYEPSSEPLHIDLGHALDAIGRQLYGLGFET